MKATEKQATWAKFTFVIGCAGTAAVVATLVVTAIAARAAVESSTAAIRQAGIAERALTEIDRPYLFTSRLLPTYVETASNQIKQINPRRFSIGLAMENVGKTPAILIAIQGEITVRRDRAGDVEIVDLEGSRGELHIKSDEKRQEILHIIRSRFISDTTWLSVILGKQFIVLNANVRYRDVFGNEYLGGIRSWWHAGAGVMVTERTKADIQDRKRTADV